MNRILIGGFKGNKNSAKLLIDLLKEDTRYKCIYLDNDFSLCANQIKKHLINYDYVILFGQKPVIKAIYIEQTGSLAGSNYISNFETDKLEEYLSKDYRIKNQIMLVHFYAIMFMALH